MTRTLKVAAATVAFLFAAVLFAVSAGAWQPLSLSVAVHGCVTATVTGSNPEGQTATVQGGNLWGKGTTIPAHGHITQTVTQTGTYTVTVNYPGDHTLRTASVQVRVPTCPTTTTTTTPPTTTPPTTAPPSTTSTTEPSTSSTTEPPPSTVAPVQQCAGDDQPTAAPVVCTSAPFAG